MSETRATYVAGPTGAVLPTDPFNQTFRDLTGHPDGAHTAPTVIKLVDFYGNATDYIVQTVRWAEGETVFLTVVQDETKRIVLPPKVINCILRQRDALATKVRRRHGRRIAAERKAAGLQPGFMKAKKKKGGGR